jgi:hypothetical protein
VDTVSRRAAGSAARVAALAAAIAGRFEPVLEPAGMLDTFEAERPAFGSSWQAPAMPSRRGWMAAAGAVPLLLILVALFATGTHPASSTPAARQPQSLELLAMHQTAPETASPSPARACMGATPSRSRRW